MITYKKLYKRLIVWLRNFLALARKYSASASKWIADKSVSIYSAVCSFSENTWKRVDSMSRVRKLFILLTFFVASFVIWQFCAYLLPQTAFVIVNILLVTAVAFFISFLIFSVRNRLAETRDIIKEMEVARKKRDHEMAALKSELMDLKMAQKNKMSFGKNSQALIDSLKKNRSERSSDEPKAQYLLKSIAQNYEICGGVVFVKDAETGIFNLSGQFALAEEPEITSITADDGIAGFAITTGKAKRINEVPADYLTVISGLGRSSALFLYVLPVKIQGEVAAVIEVTSFNKLVLADIWNDIDSSILTEI